MLSALKTKEIVIINYSGIVPTQPTIVFNLIPNIPYNFVTVFSTITASTGIVLPSFTINDELGARVAGITIVPWLFAGTTRTSLTMQTPDVPLTSLFGPSIIGTIPSELNIFNNWTITFGDFIGTPGVIVDAIFTLEQSRFK